MHLCVNVNVQMCRIIKMIHEHSFIHFFLNHHINQQISSVFFFGFVLHSQFIHNIDASQALA